MNASRTGWIMYELLQPCSTMNEFTASRSNYELNVRRIPDFVRTDHEFMIYTMEGMDADRWNRSRTAGAVMGCYHYTMRRCVRTYRRSSI